MRKAMMAGSVAIVVVMLAAMLNVGRGTEQDGVKRGKDRALIAHNVYFTLKDNSPATREKLIAACKKYLTKHDGEVFFAAGVVVKDLDRPVNDRDFDVALNIIFQNRKSHDLYQDAPRHKQFIDEMKDNWKKVRVFDAEVER